MSDTMIFGHFRRLTAAGMFVLLAACAGGPDGARPGGDASAARSKAAYLQVGFSCCNLHYDGDTITDSNFGQLPFLPAGSPVKVRQIDGYIAQVDVGSRQLRLVLEHRQETMQEWLGRIVVADDPRTKLAAFPPPIRDAISAGKLVKGMTREQAVMAVGYPQTNEKLRFEGSSWRYWWSGFAPYYVYWNGNKLVRVDGQAEVVGAMTVKIGK
jgi:hypothetical protein